MEAAIYYTKIREESRGKIPAHMVGEKLLEEGLRAEYGRDLKFEPRARGEHGKPFFTLAPNIHYNISHSGIYVMCAFAPVPVGIDVQEHRPVKYEMVLRRTVSPERMQEILEAEDPAYEFYREWVLREAYIKWTGEGLSRDLRTIPMEEGSHAFLPVDEGYSSAIWSGSPLEIRMIEAAVDYDGPAISGIR